MSETSNEPEPRTVSESFRELAEANETDGNPEAAGAYRDAANYVERSPLAIEGEVDEAAMRLRQHLGDGEIGGEEFNLSINIDGMAMFVEFENERVMFSVDEMVRGAYAMLFGEEPPEEASDG